MRLWGCWPRCRSTEVIIICIRHDVPAPEPWCLNKHLEIICVHLDLLFSGLCSSGSALTLYAASSSSPCYQQWQLILMASQDIRWNRPNWTSKSKRRSDRSYTGCLGRIWEGWWESSLTVFNMWLDEAEAFALLFLSSTYLPETPFPGRWPSQFASSLSKHFTGERLDLHLSIASHHMRTHTHTHKLQRARLHTDVATSNLPLC